MVALNAQGHFTDGPIIMEFTIIICMAAIEGLYIGFDQLCLYAYYSILSVVHAYIVPACLNIILYSWKAYIYIYIYDKEVCIYKQKLRLV